MNESGADWTAIKSLFEACVDAAPAERARRLDEAGVAAQVRAEVDGLLRAHDAAAALEDGAAAWAAPVFADGLDDAEELPAHIGPFRTLGVIGRGGMGVVCLAEREQAGARQRVAIKRIRTGLDSAELRARFRRERTILARLNHDRIARLHDGGVDESGHPWLALEYVEGVMITQWCDERRQPVRARVRLFLDVLDGVAYAHRNLVVHRDLKAGNVLVTGDGAVKLLDFGIAKLLDDDGDAHQTSAGAQLLTPASAAPEQIRGEAVSTATDVYALGVLLYALACGVEPYAATTTSREALARAVLERPPERPARALARANVDAGAIAAARATTPAGLRRELDREFAQMLDIALAKAPEQRYASADAFAADLRAWLERRPLLSRPTPRRRRAAQFVRRHRVGVAAAALVAATALAGIGATTWQARAATRNAATARAVREFTTQLLAAADPQQARGRDVPLREVLDDGARRAESGLRESPEVRAALLSDLGAIYTSLGENDRAIALLAQARDAAGNAAAADDERARILLRLADARLKAGRLDAADADAAAALTLIARRDERDPLRVDAELERAQIEAERGALAAADARLARVVAVLRGDPATAPLRLSEALDTFADLRRLQARSEDALALQTQALELVRKSDPESPIVATRLHGLATIEQQLGKTDDAIEHVREALALHRRIHGDRHPLTLSSEGQLAHALASAGHYEEAEPLFVTNIAARKAVFGADNERVGAAINNYGVMLYAQHRYAAAARQFSEVWRLWTTALGAEHASTRSALNGYGASLLETGDFEAAEPLLQQAYDLSQRLDPPRNRASARNTYALLLERRGRLADAERVLREGLAEESVAYGGEDIRYPYTRTLLGRVLRERGDIAGARDQLEHALAGYDSDEYPDGPRAASCLYQLALVRQAQHEPTAKIRPLLERALPVQEQKLGANDPDTVATRKLLAALTR